MKVTIEFNTENDAFVEDFSGEVRRLLSQARKIVTKHESHESPLFKKLLDVNGNSVGKVEIEDE